MVESLYDKASGYIFNKSILARKHILYIWVGKIQMRITKYSNEIIWIAL